MLILAGSNPAFASPKVLDLGLIGSSPVGPNVFEATPSLMPLASHY